MDFVCNQDWDAMEPTTKGRFCSICKKEVIDYTSVDIKQLIIPEQTGKNELCGRFRIEQVDPTIIRAIETPKQFRIIAFFSTFFLSVSAKSLVAQTRDTVSTEQLDVMTNPKSELSDKECDPAKANVPPLNNFKRKKPFIRTEKRSYFWTKKFPFIKVVKRHMLMGLYRPNTD